MVVNGNLESIAKRIMLSCVSFYVIQKDSDIFMNVLKREGVADM